MKRRNIKLLEQLVKIPSPSGFEREIADFIHAELAPYLPKTRIKVDSHNNVIVIIKGTLDKVVMIDTHIDEIGFVVTNIDKEGIISLDHIGGGDNAIISARHLVILTENGKINAVVDRKHAHLVDDESNITIEKIHEAIVDIGIRKRRKVSSIVKLGDPVIYASSFYQLREGYYAGRGIDDKSGCYILIETIKEIIMAKKKPTPTLIFTFSAQEEIGGLRVSRLVKTYKPNMFIEVDVTFATDYPDVDERQVGRCELGKGIVLYRGVDIDKKALKLFESVARNHKIKYQLQASSGSIGYNSEEASPYGVKTVIMAIPLRNMHTPVETINAGDLNRGIQLLSQFLIHSRLKGILEE